MRTLKTLCFLAGSAALLSGCGTSGLWNRQRPDEFAVQRQAPLVVPPDFALAPPKPGAPRPDAPTAEELAQDALFGPPQARSAIESHALSQAGDAAPGIRSNVGDPATHTVDKGQITRNVVAAPQGDGASAQVSIPAG
jgi:uncharacterized lipoprotein